MSHVEFNKYHMSFHIGTGSMLGVDFKKVSFHHVEFRSQKPLFFLIWESWRKVACGVPYTQVVSTFTRRSLPITQTWYC